MSSSEKDQRIRWGLIGPGRAAARFAQGLAAVSGANLTAVWGRNPDKARAFAERFSIPDVSGTVAEFLALPIDAVYVATHPDTHADLCIQALRAGKHVFCEKPAALNVRQLEQVVATAKEHDQLFMEAMKPPFFPLYRKLREHLQADPIGLIGYVRAGHCDSTLSPDYPLHFPELAAAESWASAPTRHFWLSIGSDR